MGGVAGAYASSPRVKFTALVPEVHGRPSTRGGTPFNTPGGESRHQRFGASGLENVTGLTSRFRVG